MGGEDAAAVPRARVGVGERLGVLERGLAGGLGALLGLAYYVYFLSSTGQTLGAKVMGIKVVDGNGKVLSTGSAVVRVLGSYVSGMLLGIGYLWMLRDADKQTLHDKMAGSYVVLA